MSVKHPIWPLLNDARHLSASDLQQFDLPTIREGVLSWLTSWASETNVDGEAIEEAGTLAGELNPEGLDTEVVQQLEGLGDVEAVRGAFLAGFWRQAGVSDGTIVRDYSRRALGFPALSAECASVLYGVCVGLWGHRDAYTPAVYQELAELLISGRERFKEAGVHENVTVLLDEWLASDPPFGS